MAKKDMQTKATWLLLISGLILVLPRFGVDALSTLGDGWLQTIVGALAVICALMCLKK